jgi:ribonuclease P protein component
MLPSANRLRRETEIKRVLAGKFSHKTGLLVCKTAANKMAAARFCFVVSKRVSNKAAIRNKLKRRLRAAVAANLARILPGFDCVLIAYPGLESREYQEIAAMVKRALLMSSILKA